MRAEDRGLLLVAGSYSARGGLQRRLQATARLAAEHGPATVVTWRRGLRWSRELRPDGVLVVTLPALADWDRDHSRPLALANTAVSVGLGTAAALLLRRRWHVAFAGGLDPEGLVAGIAARLLGRPFVLRTWLPGPIGNVARLLRSPIAPLLRRLLVTAHAVVAETDEMSDELVAAGFDRRRIVVLDTGLDLAGLRPSTPAEREAARRGLGLAAEGIAVYCGRFDLRQKRLDLLLAAWERAGLAGWRLVLVGGGPDERAVEEQARGLDGVLVRGWQDDVAPYLASADVAVLPTNFEGNAAALLEALACGLPAVVSATSGYRRLAAPGTLCADGVDEWSATLRRLAADPALRAELGHAGRAWIERRHDPSVARARVLALLGYPPAATGRAD